MPDRINPSARNYFFFSVRVLWTARLMLGALSTVFLRVPTKPLMKINIHSLPCFLSFLQAGLSRKSKETRIIWHPGGGEENLGSSAEKPKFAFSFLYCGQTIKYPVFFPFSKLVTVEIKQIN